MGGIKKTTPWIKTHPKGVTLKVKGGEQTAYAPGASLAPSANGLAQLAPPSMEQVGLQVYVYVCRHTRGAVAATAVFSFVFLVIFRCYKFN